MTYLIPNNLSLGPKIAQEQQRKQKRAMHVEIHFYKRLGI